MPAYNFIALNAKGEEKSGVIEAESVKHARQLVRDQALVPINVHSVQEKEKKTSHFRLYLGAMPFNSKVLALFTRQLATLLYAGLPVESALLAVAEQTEKTAVKGLILSVRSKVMEGYTLAASFSEHPQVFSRLFCVTIAAGEKSGHLNQVLSRLADYTEQQWKMRQKIKTALIYPLTIICVAIGIVGFLLTYVVPKMVTVYENFHQTLPLLTRVLITLSESVSTYGVIFVGLMGISWYGATKWIRKRLILREKMHRFLLRLPLIGYARKTMDTARFVRTLSILCASGVPLLEAMTLAAQLITLIPIRQAILAAVQQVHEGRPLSLALKQTGYCSPMSIHMVASGEASGQLEHMLERVALHQEEEMSRWMEVGLALFEPAIVLVMGMVVLFIVLAILLPIFNLNELV